MKNQFLSVLKKTIANRGVILMYHQVATLPCDPWQLAVSSEKFESQLKVLKKNFDVVPLDELSRIVRTFPSRRRKIAITFDDGFKDNYHTAAPLLERYHLPATFYIATKLINTNGMFWWDMLQHLILYTKKLPSSLDMMISGKSFHYELQEASILTEQLRDDISQWNYEKPIPNKRVDLYLKIWEQLKNLSIDDRDSAIHGLKEWAGDHYSSPGLYGVMNVNELKALNNKALFTIGAHTVNHPALGTQPTEQQFLEINQSKEILQEWLNMKINSFAYPYGHYQAITTSLLRDAGFDHAVTTAERPVTRSSSALELPRYQVKNWSGEELYQNILNWLTH